MRKLTIIFALIGLIFVTVKMHSCYVAVFPPQMKSRPRPTPSAYAGIYGLDEPVPTPTLYLPDDPLDIKSPIYENDPARAARPENPVLWTLLALALWWLAVTALRVVAISIGNAFGVSHPRGFRRWLLMLFPLSLAWRWLHRRVWQPLAFWWEELRRDRKSVV